MEFWCHYCLGAKCFKGISVSCNTSNTRDSVSSGYPNTEKRVENIFDEIWGVGIADETLDISSVWYILSIETKTKEKMEK